MRKLNKRKNLFINFLLFNLCFFGLQLLFVYSNSKALIQSITLPWSMYLEFIATISVHILLYIMLAMLQTELLLGILKKKSNTNSHTIQPIQRSEEYGTYIIWFLSTGLILSANAYFFPLSGFSKIFSPPLPPFFISAIFYIFLFSFVYLFIDALQYSNSLRGILLFIVVTCCYNFFKSIPKPIFNTNQPNIILLGIDSLSPESVSKETMPFFYSLIENSIQFTNSISPLARTYPAWCSILTGLYAKHHHADENLVTKRVVESNQSIIWQLKKHGYINIYATDDRRFNNIDKEFGFEQIIGPRLGANDVILGSYNDFPLGNLLINFQLSAWIFPYNHANRASYFSYYPSSFNKKLQNELSRIKYDQPVFLAVHFTLPHWPYAYAPSSPEEVNNEFSLNKRASLYIKALKGVDQQFKEFFIYLQKNQFLSNSLLVLLSDHGETLYYPNSRLTNTFNYQGHKPSKLATYFKQKTATILNKSAGHGSDILSPKQYHTILSFNVFKNNQLISKPHRFETRVALIDLAPTILEFLGINKNQFHLMDGLSLYSSFFQPNYSIKERSFYLESGMYPNQSFSKEKAIALGHKIYSINEETKILELKTSELTEINKHKLYGIINGPWILSLYPDEQSYIPVIQNLITGAWSDDLYSDFSKRTPANQLKLKLEQFYGTNLAFPIP